MPFTFIFPAMMEAVAQPNHNASLSRRMMMVLRLTVGWFKGCWLMFIGLLLLTTSAVAQTPVSGAIAVDTRWSVANTPFVVSGDMVLQNGAILTIDPGVTVYMAAAASLTVQSGGVMALGTAANPIQVLSDKSRLGQTAAPGDWRQWAFNSGAVNTRLDHVVFEHGSGVTVKGSAPIFNYLNLRNQQGAAITIDLAASPSGVGNQASGNTVNGITVPAGDISGSVKWGLRGIPYVVASGVVSVGASPTVTLVTPNRLQQGETVTVNISGSRLSGLTNVRFDKAGLAAQILPGATDTQASVSVTAEASVAVGATALRLLADAGEVRVANALTLIQSQPTLTNVTPPQLHLGQGVVDLVINGRNFANQSVVQVNGAAATTQFLSATQLRASIATPASLGNLLVRLSTPDPANAGQYLTSNELALPVIPAQLAVTPSPAAVAKGAVKVFTVTLPYPAPTGGVSVSLVSSVPTVATVPATLVISAGQNSASFQLTATDLGNSVVTASKVGFLSGQAQVTVIPPPTLTLTPATVTMGVGRITELTLQSSVPAGTSGLTVGLASNVPGIVTIPASVTIPAGASSVTVSITTVAIGMATVTAQTADFVSGSTTVTVRPVSLNLPAGALVAPGLARSIPISLSDPAPAGGLVIALASSNVATATVPASITVPAGQFHANFTLTGVMAGAMSISATATGYQSATLPVTVEAVTIGIGRPAVNSVSVPVDNSQAFVITLSRPAPAGGVVIDLATSDASKATVSPSSIIIAEGQTSGGVVLASVTGVAKGATTLSASAAGLNAASVPLTVTGKPALAFSTGAVTVGKGLKTYFYEVGVSRKTDGNSYAPNHEQIVNLTSANNIKANVPATVTIPAGQASVYFYVTGVDLTNGIPVTVDATAAGYSAPATKLAVNVVAPVFTFISLDANRSPASARDDFFIHVTTPGAIYSGHQTAAADIPINLAIVDGSPAGIVEGFYGALTGGAAITQVVLRKDTNYTHYGSGVTYVGTPTAAGSYKVQASASGVATVTSSLVTVSAPELKFSTANNTSSVTVGKGLNTYLYEVYVYRAVNGTAFNGSEALTVNLSSSNAAKANVPATVTIPAGQASVYFYVTGVDLTNGTPVTVDATAAGYSAPATKLAVNVVAPAFTIISLDANRSPASARDDFVIYVTAPGAIYSGSQTAAADIPINLAIVDGSPAGIVEGFYGALTGGAAITQVVLRKDTNYTHYGSGVTYVGTPTAAGSYKVQASASGVATVTSSLVTVSAPELKFSTANNTSSVTVGKGLNTYLYEVYVYRAVNGSAFNGSEALTVNLACSSTVICGVPAGVTIPAGQSSAYFQVEGVGLGNTTITASAVGYSATQDLGVNVTAPQLNFSGPGNITVGGQSNFSVYLTTPGAVYSGSQTAASAITVNLTSSAPGVATAPTTVMIQAGNIYSNTAKLTGVAAGTTTLTASGSGLSSVTSSTITINP